MIILGMFVEHDRQVFVDWQQFAERVLLDQFPRTTVRQHVTQRPIGVVRPDNTARTFHPCLVTVPQDLSSYVAETTDVRIKWLM